MYLASLNLCKMQRKMPPWKTGRGFERGNAIVLCYAWSIYYAQQIVASFCFIVRWGEGGVPSLTVEESMTLEVGRLLLCALLVATEGAIVQLVSVKETAK